MADTIDFGVDTPKDTVREAPAQAVAVVEKGSGTKAALDKKASDAKAAKPAAEPVQSVDPARPPRPAQQVYKIHPLSEMYPQMTDDEYVLLYEDVKRTGFVREPIVLFEGQILDGRHRYQVVDDAWDKEGIEIPFRTRDFDPATEGEPVDFVHSANFTRRSLDATQKAMLGVKYHDYFAKITTQGRKKKGDDTPAQGEARERAAKMSGVSGKTISTAIRVREADPKLWEDMASGAINVWNAEKVIKRRQEEEAHKAAVSNGTVAVKQDFELFNWKVQRVAEDSKLAQYPDDIPVTVWITETVLGNGSVTYSVLVETVETEPRQDSFDIATNLNDAKRAALKSYHYFNGRQPVEPEKPAKAAPPKSAAAATKQVLANAPKKGGPDPKPGKAAASKKKPATEQSSIPM